MPVQKDSPIGSSAFLIEIDRDWEVLNQLSKDPSRINEWRGVLYCERFGERDRSELAEQWGEHSLVAEPFIFYGDNELLARVQTALASVAPPASC